MPRAEAAMSPPQQELNGAEALMGFLSWLTTRAAPVTFSARHEAGIACQLFEQFCTVNPCGHLGADWPDCLTHMPEEASTLTNEAQEGFEAQLTRLLNYHSLENGSDTPDYILAAYLLQCLDIFNLTMTRREAWYGRSVSGRMAVSGVLAEVPESETTHA